ncbi:MAG: hypothetical protein A2V66_08815 [Ignavibacteria bacterium RBG_13_36_8]|nr:MAG: hypothetical protein A2V66_08815 [Ignavibacteria bacterium RBG_13_36_8]
MEYKENPKSYDPRMHSAEHILNQTMVKMFNRGRSINAHIEKKKSKCDYYFDRDLTDQEKSEIEIRINELIQKDLPVYEEFISYDEADKLFNLKRIPEDVGESVRVIKIGDYDACPCSGPHVKTTKEIGTFKLVSTSYEDNILRVRFKLQEL